MAGIGHLRAGQRRGVRNWRRRRWRRRHALPETRLVEGFLLAEHVIHGPAQSRREDGQRLALALVRGQPLLPALGALARSQEQAGGFAEGPAQVRIADLLAAAAQPLARRLV